MSRRVRASTPRTKTGCANCRQRRIKCDEAEPGCERCRRSGWNCPGYTQTNGADPATFTSVVTARMPPNVSGITQYSLPFKVPGSQEERRALHYFSNFAAADLTGYIPSSFWSRTVLQRCQHDVPVRHAAAALGRVHMEFVSGADSFAPSDESVEAYRKSVKALRNYLGRQTSPDRAMVLICSAIFFCFELVRGDRRTALRHLRGGLEILSEWSDSENLEPGLADTKEELVAVFARMDLQATMFDDGRVPVLQVDEDTAAHWAHPTAREISAFRSLDEAQQSLFILLHNAFSFLVQNVAYKFADIRTVPEFVIHCRRKLADRFYIWERKLKLFEYEQKSKLEDIGVISLDDQRRALSAAKLHYRTIKLLLLHCLQDDVMSSAPSFDDEADSLLDLGRDVLSGDIGFLSTVATSRRCFYLHLGVVAPIFLLALKTSRLYVVQAAIELLKATSGRREGFYDAEQMAEVIKSLAKMQGKRDSQPSYVSVEERLLAGEPLSPSLEWITDEVMDVQVPYYWQDEEGRWKGFDRLLALVA